LGGEKNEKITIFRHFSGLFKPDQNKAAFENGKTAAEFGFFRLRTRFDSGHDLETKSTDFGNFQIFFGNSKSWARII
jgi:hypothetical protein